MSPPGTYFVTAVTWHKRPLFQAESMARLFLRTLYDYRRQSKYCLHAFVLMPEQFHLLLTPSQDLTLERTLQLVKGGYSHAAGVIFGKKIEIWERGFTNHRIRDEEDFQHHRQYIHNNPVVRGLSLMIGEYRYCSAFPGFKLDSWPSSGQELRQEEKALLSG